jgi:hypothetical protein
VHVIAQRLVLGRKVDRVAIQLSRSSC